MVTGDITLASAECATEQFEIASCADIEPGTVIVIDQAKAIADAFKQQAPNVEYKYETLDRAGKDFTPAIAIARSFRALPLRNEFAQTRQGGRDAGKQRTKNDPNRLIFQVADSSLCSPPPSPTATERRVPSFTTSGESGFQTGTTRRG